MPDQTNHRTQEGRSRRWMPPISTPCCSTTSSMMPSTAGSTRSARIAGRLPKLLGWEPAMGQYYLIVNLDKKQYLHPHRCGDGLKLLEFGCSATGTLTALAILLADGNGRGGGDLRSENPVIGSWAGDRIVIAGDYADEGKFTGDPASNLYAVAGKEYQDISRQALAPWRMTTTSPTR